MNVFVRKIQCQFFSSNYMFQIFLHQFIVFSVGRGVCLPAGWVKCHGLMYISTEQGAVEEEKTKVLFAPPVCNYFFFKCKIFGYLQIACQMEPPSKKIGWLQIAY